METATHVSLSCALAPSREERPFLATPGIFTFLVEVGPAGISNLPNRFETDLDEVGFLNSLANLRGKERRRRTAKRCQQQSRRQTSYALFDDFT